MNCMKFLCCVASVFLFYGTVYAGVSVCVVYGLRGNKNAGPTISIYCLSSVAPDVNTPMIFKPSATFIGSCDGYSIYSGHVTHCSKAGADFTLMYQTEVP